MSNLLNLVDLLIGNILQKNIYTDTKQYTELVKSSSPINDQMKKVSEPLSPFIERNDIYLKSDSLERKGKPLSDDIRDLVYFHESKAHPHNGRPHIIPRPGDDSGQMEHRPDGLAPTQHGRPPVGKEPTNYEDGELRKWKNIGENGGVDRTRIYYPNNQPPDVIDQGKQTETLAVQSTQNPPGVLPKFEKLFSYDEKLKADFYKTPNSNVGGTALSIQMKGQTQGDILNQQGLPTYGTKEQAYLVSTDLSFKKGEAFSEDKRKETYRIAQKNEQLISNIGGTPRSNETLGDINSKLGQPPSPSLEFKGPTAGDVPPFEKITGIPDQGFQKEAFNNSNREEFYKITEKNKQIISNIGGTSISKPTQGDLLNQQGLPTSNIQQQSNVMLENQEFSNLNSYSNDTRNEIYGFRDEADKQLRASIATSQFSKPTSGDSIASNGLPPPSLMDVNESKRKTLAGEQGNLNSNIFSPEVASGFVPFIGKFAPISQRPAPSFVRFADFIASANWLRNIVRELGIPIPLGVPEDNLVSADRIVKGVTFLASQVLLTSLNNSDLGTGNATWNPASLGASIPFLAGLDETSISFATPYKKATQDTIKDSNDSERLLQMRNGMYIEINPVQQFVQTRLPMQGFLGDTSKVGETDNLTNPNLDNVVSVQSQVDQEGILKDLVPATVHKNIYTSNNPYGIDGTVKLDNESVKKSISYNTKILDGDSFSVDKLFRPAKFPGGSALGDNKGALTWYAIPAKKGTDLWHSSVNAYSRRPDNLDAEFVGNEGLEEKGLISVPPNDDDIYMPFCFQDLRYKEDKFLYFRALIRDGSSETFTPSWQTERYYGRVDEIPIYAGTTRTISLTFDVVAWSYGDLPVIWQKLHLLQSMVYPLYDTEGFMKSAPIIKMRVGDLFAAYSGTGTSLVKKGLPGYITSLDFSYDDGIWEIESGWKVPRKVTVSLNFTVLHEGNPGLYDASSGERFFGALSKFTVNGPDLVEIVASPSKIRSVIKKVDEFYESFVATETAEG